MVTLVANVKQWWLRGTASRISAASGPDFSNAVEWKSHPHVAKIPYLWGLWPSGPPREVAWTFKRHRYKQARTPAPVQAGANHHRLAVAAADNVSIGQRH